MKTMSKEQSRLFSFWKMTNHTYFVCSSISYCITLKGDFHRKITFFHTITSLYNEYFFSFKKNGYFVLFRNLDSIKMKFSQILGQLITDIFNSPLALL